MLHHLAGLTKCVPKRVDGHPIPNYTVLRERNSYRVRESRIDHKRALTADRQ